MIKLKMSSEFLFDFLQLHKLDVKLFDISYNEATMEIELELSSKIVDSGQLKLHYERATTLQDAGNVLRMATIVGPKLILEKKL